MINGNKNNLGIIPALFFKTEFLQDKIAAMFSLVLAKRRYQQVRFVKIAKIAMDTNLLILAFNTAN